MKKVIFSSLAALAALVSCSKIEYVDRFIDPVIAYDTTVNTVTHEEGVTELLYEDVLLCNEGSWQSDNGQLSRYNSLSNTLTNKWFQSVNGFKLGDTPNDIIAVNDSLIAIAVNWSNIVQFIRPDGTSCGYTEDIPNNRKLCKDDNGYLYITSYAHECGEMTFEKGYVAKIDIDTKKVVSATEVGYEPEGIQYYNGKLFVANTGGYAFSEGHDYEHSISVIDAETMQVLDTVELFGYDDTPVINLYGTMSICGNFLLLNSPGDYMEIPARSVIFDCNTYEYTVLDFPATYNTSDGKYFYTVGSSFSYSTYEYEYYICTIDPFNMDIQEEIIDPDVTGIIAAMQNPYDIYVSPYTKNLFVTDAASYAGAGKLTVFGEDGQIILDNAKTYVCPAHMVAVPRFATNTENSTETTITITPHVSWSTKALTPVSVNDRAREYFAECWSKATK